MAKILIVDDEPRIRDLIRAHLEHEGFSCEEAGDGGAALSALSNGDVDLVILDIMMPFVDGMTCLKEMRSRKINTPVIMLTARGEEYDKLVGLEGGADDYVVKPFDTKEVVARIKAVLRRCHCAESGDKNVIQFENLSLDMSQYQLKVKGKIVEAPPKELELLAYLAGHPNRVFTRDQLLDEVWGFEYYGDSRTIDVHIKRLREKLEGASEKWSLKTVWGVGYKFEVKD